MIESYMFGGPTQNIEAPDMMFGFKSKIGKKLEGGDFLWGSDYAIGESIVTPVMNDNARPSKMATQ